MLRNSIVIIVVVLSSTAYLWLIASLVPGEYALLVNFGIVPGLIGLLTGYLLVGPLIAKLLMLLVVPITHVLVFGGDPAKPGLENLLAVAELAPLYLGCIVVHLLLWVANSQSSGDRGLK